MQGPIYSNQSFAPITYEGPPQPNYQPGPYPAYPYELAGFGARFAAYFIDSIILSIITAPVSFYLNSHFIPDENLPLDQLLHSLLILIAIGTIIGFAASITYFTALEGGNRNATLGKRLLKIRVLDIHKQPIGMKEAFIRNLGRFGFIPGLSSIILLIDTILILVTDRQQRIGDRMAHTIVVKDRWNPPQYPPMYYPPQAPYYQPPYQQPPPQQGNYQQPNQQNNEPYRRI